MYVLPCFPAAQTGFLFLENYCSDKVCILFWGGFCFGVFFWFGFYFGLAFFSPFPLSLMKFSPLSVANSLSHFTLFGNH